SEDEILLVGRGATSPARIGSLRVHLIRHGFVEVKLRSEFMALSGCRIGANFKVNVHGSPRIPAGIDREKFGCSFGVRHLIAAEKLLPPGTEQPVPVP